MFDAIIIGAGPAGSRTAELLAKSGLSVLVLEKKSAVGKPACSGLVSRRIRDIVPLKKGLVLHSVRGARFHAGKDVLFLKKQAPVAFVLDRPEFDKYVLERARKAGAEVHMSEPFLEYSLESGTVLVNNKYRASVLVGADGAASRVRQASGLAGNLVFMNGAITYFKEKNADAYVDVFYDRRFSPDFFAWRIPHRDFVEYGVASRKDHLRHLGKFLKTQNRRLVNFYSHPMVSGIQETAGERLILVGDAAAQVKPFSGGGIIYGLICAGIAAKSIISAVRKNDFSREFFRQNYDRKWKEKLLGRLELGSAMLFSIKSLTAGELSLFFSVLKEKKGEAEAFADMDFL